MKTTICLFAKAPNPGQAKTRLAPVLGNEGAAHFARALLLDALDEWKTSELLIAHTGEMSASLWRRMKPFHQVSQGQGDLGARMERVLTHTLRTSDVAIAVGTDIPGLGEEQAALATAKLKTHDAVLGPSEDGGFYLLAVKRCPKGLLDDVPWSSTNTLAITRERLASAGMRVALLDTRYDVDKPADLRRLAAELAAEPEAMPHTRRFLASPENRAISVIVPILNEEARLASQLSHLRDIPGIAETIVVDGGSTDASLQIAASFDTVRVVPSGVGRALQMNTGAATAFGGTLLFLHADTKLPTDACEQVHDALQQAQAGAFRLRTQYDIGARHRPWVASFLPLADMRSRYTRFPYGDQALFVRTKLFRRVGGYPRLPLFEDLALSIALHKLAPLHKALGPVQVSARRFQERPFYYLALMNSFPLLYRLGVSPKRLASFYHHTR